MQKPIRTIASLAVIAMIASKNLNAGAFSLYTESSPAAIGNFAAGIAAEGADAAIGWYNPAGLVLLDKPQFVVGGIGVFPRVSLSGNSTYNTLVPNPSLPFITYTENFSGLQGGENAVIPAVHYALPLDDKTVFGLSIVSPFGLSTNYGETSQIRYASTLSKLETITVSPELGRKLSDNFSIGAGLDLQYARVSFNSVIGSPAWINFFPSSEVNALDSLSDNTGDSFGVGFHAGIMLTSTDKHSRLGFNYQSAVAHKFYGVSTLTGILADPNTYTDNPITGNPNAIFSSDDLNSGNIDMPQIFTLSGYRDITQKLALLGSVVFTGWSSFKNITLNNVAVGLPIEATGDITQTTMDIVAPEDYRNTWRFSLGANYHINDKLMLRTGGGYDQTPTVNSERDTRLPDSNRVALAIGAHYQIRHNIGLDAGYSYLFGVSDAYINKTIPLGDDSTYNVNASGKGKVQLVGLQVVWQIDAEKSSTK